MTECNICYETKEEKILPCSHSVCTDCYERLQGDNCPYCRQPFRESTNVVPPEQTDGYFQRYMFYYYNNQLLTTQLNTTNRRFRRLGRFRR